MEPVKWLLGLLLLLLVSRSNAVTVCNKIDIKSQNSRLELNGQVVNFKGINYWGLETGLKDLFGLWIRPLDSILADLQSMNFNLLRVPFSAELLMIDNNWARLDELIDKAAQRGIAILLDLHRMMSNGQDPLWYNPATPFNSPQSVVQVWEAVARRYKDKVNVIGADLKNEPQTVCSWGDNNPNTDWALAAEQIGNAILKIAPNWLIFVSGVSGGSQLPAGCSQSVCCLYWGNNLEGTRCRQIDLIDDTKLVYAPHIYGPSVYNQPYFGASNFPDNLPAIWEQGFGFVAKLTGRAVVVTEWGGTAVGQDGVVQQAQADYFRAKGFSSTYWGVNPESGDTGGIFLNDWKTVDAKKLAIINSAHPVVTQFVFSTDCTETSPSKSPAAPAASASKSPAAPAASASKSPAAPAASASKSPAAPAASASRSPAAPAASASKSPAAPAASASKSPAAPAPTGDAEPAFFAYTMNSGSNAWWMAVEITPPPAKVTLSAIDTQGSTVTLERTQPSYIGYRMTGWSLGNGDNAPTYKPLDSTNPQLRVQACDSRGFCETLTCNWLTKTC